MNDSGMTDLSPDLTLPDAGATEALGAALARAYVASGRGSGIVYWNGELGAGKTTCVRSVLRTLGVDGPIRSPTYTLVAVYEPDGITCVHVDLYRLKGPADIEELGLRDYLGGDCLWLVEWPEKGATVLPSADLDVTLRYTAHGRQARLAAPSARGRAWLNLLLRDTSLAPYVSNLT